MMNILAQNPIYNLIFIVLAYFIFKGGMRPQIELMFFSLQILGILTTLRALPAGGFSLGGVGGGFGF
jgi:hypothetical protein